VPLFSCTFFTSFVSRSYAYRALKAVEIMGHHRGTILWALLMLILSGGSGPYAQDSTKRLGLALSGGGSRGLAQIGVLEAIEEAGIRPDLVVGTSMGAIIAALYAAGYSAIEIAEFAKRTDWRGVLSNTAQRPKLLVVQKDEPVDYLVELRFERNLAPKLPTSLSHGQQIYGNLVRYLAPAQYHARNDFDRFAVPLRIVATDILSGRCVVISKGNIANAIRASCGVPMAFSPLPRDSMLLMDGGLTANIPVGAARESGCTFVIAVNVTSPLWTADDLDNPVRLMDQVVAIGVEARKAEETQHADAVIKPDLEGIKNTDFSQINTLIARGYAACKAALPSILARLDSVTTVSSGDTSSSRDTTLSNGDSATVDTSKSTDTIQAFPSVRWEETDPTLSRHFEQELATCRSRFPAAAPRTAMREALTRLRTIQDMPYCRMTYIGSTDSTLTVALDPGVVHGIEVCGNERTRTRMISAATNLREGDILHTGTIPLTISTLYATGLFNTVNADVDTDGVVRIFVQEKPYLRARLGLRYDQFLLGEGFLEAAHENLFGLGISCIVHLQYGLRREKYALELKGNHLISPWWANNVRIQGYVARESIVERTEIPDPSDSTGTGYIVSYQEQSLRKAEIGRASCRERV
jgi:NTE family protein